MMTADKKTSKHAQTHFSNYKSVGQLKALAKKPFDLTIEGNLTPERIDQFKAEACGFKLLYGTQRITEDVLDALEALAKESKALERMQDMQAGKKTNFLEGVPSENRSVLHTAMRDFFDHPNTSSVASEAAKLAKEEHQKLQDFLKKIEKDNRFSHLVTIAIGGSDLGPKAVYIALKYLQKKGRDVHFISNIDPDDVIAVLNEVDLKKTLFVVVSKSGSTLETITNEAFVRSKLEAAGLKPKDHIVSITTPGSAIDKTDNYLACFHSWDYVGGRFSTTAIYGGFTLSFALGYENYLEFLRGAHEMDLTALKPSLKQNLPLLMALLGIWNRNFLNYPTVVLVPYSQALSRFSAHIQQVDMESNGKRIDHYGVPVDFETGPIVWGEPGTCAQHSFYQLIHQGTSPIPLELVGFKDDQYGEDFVFRGTTSQDKLLSNLFAQVLAFALGRASDNPNQVFPGNRPSSLLIGEKLTPYAMGAIFALYEHKVAFQGFIWDINSFDQEGVMLGKQLALQILGRLATKRDPKQKSEAFPLGDALIKQLDSFKNTRSV